jgi:hypothetical protein
VVVAVHQPNFIPWIGYFDKIAQADIFVLLDTVQYPRSKSVANRNCVKTKSGALEIVVPIAHPKGSQRLSTYQEVEFADHNWKKKALNTLTHAYGRAPCFEEVFALLQRCFDQATFVRMNNLFIQEVVKALGLSTKLVNLSDLPTVGGTNNAMIIAICEAFNATCYLSGKGAMAYNDECMYDAHGIKLAYQSYVPLEYPQLHGDFIPNLSVVDPLFNLGFEATAQLLTKTKS